MEVVLELKEGILEKRVMKRMVHIILAYVLVLGMFEANPCEKLFVKETKQVTEFIEYPVRMKKLEQTVAIETSEHSRKEETEKLANLRKEETEKLECSIEVETEMLEYPIETVPEELIEIDKIETEAEFVENKEAEGMNEWKQNEIMAEVLPENEDVLKVTASELKEHTEVNFWENTEDNLYENSEMTEEVLVESPFLIDAEGMIYQFRPEYWESESACLELPKEGCVGIRKGTFLGCAEYISEVVMPKNIVRIEEGVLTELLTLEWITIEAGNPSYQSMDGALFNLSGTSLLSYPPARTGAYFVPENVENVSEYAFLNSHLSVVDIRGCGLSANCLLNISQSCSIIE